MCILCLLYLNKSYTVSNIFQIINMWATSRYTNRHFSSFASLISSIEVIEF